MNWNSIRTESVHYDQAIVAAGRVGESEPAVSEHYLVAPLNVGQKAEKSCIGCNLFHYWINFIKNEMILWSGIEGDRACSKPYYGYLWFQVRTVVDGEYITDGAFRIKISQGLVLLGCLNELSSVNRRSIVE